MGFFEVVFKLPEKRVCRIFCALDADSERPFILLRCPLFNGYDRLPPQHLDAASFKAQPCLECGARAPLFPSILIKTVTGHCTPGRPQPGVIRFGVVEVAALLSLAPTSRTCFLSSKVNQEPRQDPCWTKVAPTEMPEASKWSA